MKNIGNKSIRQRGMTLVELLVVFSIIAVLAGLIVPALSGAKRKAQIMKGRKDMADFKQSITVYRSDYSRMPTSNQAQAAANSAVRAVDKDFAYGSFGLTHGTRPGEFKSTIITNDLPTWHEANNSELTLILTATTAFPSSTNTVNANHVKNVRKNQYLSTPQVTGIQHGIGADGVFRDPWLNPYIVTLDLNYDNFVAPIKYRFQTMSQATGAEGLRGLLDKDPNNTDWNEFGLRDSVAVWSLGPDGRYDVSIKANKNGVVGAQKVDNNDNLLSWQ